MMYCEVKNMEEQKQPQIQGQERIPTPRWKVWAARVGALIMIVSFLLYCWHIASGGMLW